jgi:hypothetical protein
MDPRYLNFFGQVGIAYDEFKRVQLDLRELNATWAKISQRALYERFLVSGSLVEYNKYHPKHPNPPVPTYEDIRRRDELQKKLNVQVGTHSTAYWQHQAWRLKLQRKTNLPVYALSQTDEFLREEGWDWSIKAKKLIDKDGWALLSDHRVKFMKAPDHLTYPVQGAMFRNMSGLGHTIMMIDSIGDNIVTYSRYCQTNFGFPLVAPPSKNPAKCTLEQFANRNFRIVEMVYA